MFVDSALVSVRAGKGGNGTVSFRHEKYVEMGGPDGGDGGRGGNVVFEADERKNTLVDFRYKPEVRAKDGEAGGKRQKHGRNGEDIIVAVPVGTQIYRDDIVIADLVTKGQQAVIAKGGDGGFGNAHFKSSTRQAPRVAELGEAGDEFEARLELKLLADVGLIGFPNAGKSTFLSVVSNARPEIADYAFTTLTPNLGVADIDDTSLLIADIPGLIEGASQGKGLGDAFLRHVERSAVLLHLIDAYSDDVAAAYTTIREELRRYKPELLDHPEVVALTKTEGLDPEIIQMQIDSLRTVVDKGTPIFAISSSAHSGIKELLRQLVKKVAAERNRFAALALEDSADDDTIPTISLSDRTLDDAWTIEKTDEGYAITGPKIEKFALRTDFNNVHSVNRLRDIMRKRGMTSELTRLGASGDSVIVIGDSSPFSLHEK
ncbi:MAG: GTPase ObgE [Candidatus Saccharimonadales bacterium]